MKAPGKFGWVAATLITLAGGMADATPSHRVKITERLLGTGGKTYAVLRTEDDNCRSYYQSKTKVHFIERATNGSAPEKATLLAETETIVDATHNDPKTPAPVTTRVISRNDSLSLTDALLRYPVSESETWDPTKLTRLQVHPASGVSLDGRLRMALDTEIKALFGTTPEEFGGKPDEWKVDGVFEQGTCLFLSLVMEMPEGGPETRIMGLSEHLSDQVNAHLGREDIYLSAGTFITPEEALGRVESWKAEGKKQITYGHWEVWSRRLPTTKIDHVLVLTRTKEMRQGPSKRIEEETGIRLEAISSDRFVERTQVPRY